MKFRAVLSPPEKIPSHRPLLGRATVIRSMTDVLFPEALGNQDLDRLAEELLSVIPEELLGLRVHPNDLTVSTNGDDRVWRKLKETMNDRFAVLTHPHLFLYLN